MTSPIEPAIIASTVTDWIVITHELARRRLAASTAIVYNSDRYHRDHPALLLLRLRRARVSPGYPIGAERSALAHPRADEHAIDRHRHTSAGRYAESIANTMESAVIHPHGLTFTNAFVHSDTIINADTYVHANRHFNRCAAILHTDRNTFLNAAPHVGADDGSNSNKHSNTDRNQHADANQYTDWDRHCHSNGHRNITAHHHYRADSCPHGHTETIT